MFKENGSTKNLETNQIIIQFIDENVDKNVYEHLKNDLDIFITVANEEFKKYEGKLIHNLKYSEPRCEIILKVNALNDTRKEANKFNIEGLKVTLPIFCEYSRRRFVPSTA